MPIQHFTVMAMRTVEGFFSLAMAAAGLAALATAGCFDPTAGNYVVADRSSTTSAALTVPLPTINQYVILAARTVVIGERSVVSGGHIGVAPTTEAGPSALIGGSGARIGVGKALLAETVVLGPTAITGEVAASQFVLGHNVTTGPRSPYVAPAAAPQPGAVAAGGPAITVASSRTQSLAPGAYGVVTVNGALNLTGGLYQVQRLQLGANARLTALAASTIRIATGLAAAAGARVTPAAGLTAGDLRIVAAGVVDASNNSILFAADGRLTALVIARHNFRAGDRLNAAGAITAEDLFLAPDTRLTFDTGFACATTAACGGSGVCRLAACVDARCAATDAPDGTTCDDGNICSRADSCRAGACAGSPVVTEYPTALSQPHALLRGPDDYLWFISSGSAPDATDGVIARLAPATGVITRFPTDRRLLDLKAGPDGNFWFAGRLPAEDNGLSTIGRITPAGLFGDELVGLFADQLAAGPDGNIWFASEVTGQNILGAVRPADGLITALLFVSNNVRAMAAGPDGNVWLAQSNGGGGPALIGRVTPDSVLTEFPIATTGNLNALTLGPDGNLWFTDDGQNEIGRITPDGDVVKFPVPSAASGLYGLAAGADGSLWFTQRTANQIGRISPTGQVLELPCLPTPDSGPTSIAAGPDGHLWFTTSRGAVARVDLP